MANTPAAASSARISGTLSGRNAPTTLNQAASLALRSTGACQSAATRSFGNARLTQKVRPPAVTRQMSDETPPVSRSKQGVSPAATSPPAATKRTIVGSGISGHRAALLSSAAVLFKLQPPYDQAPGIV